MSISSGSVRGMPRLILRLEGLALFVGAIVAYAHLGQAWWIFATLVLTPDLSMLAYLMNVRIGAVAYNVAHSIASAAALAGVGLVLHDERLLAFTAIWVAHIGVDRALGYGLKYATMFADTHLGLIGASGRGPTRRDAWPAPEVGPEEDSIAIGTLATPAPFR